MQYTVYDKNTGVILDNRIIPDGAELKVRPRQGFVEGEWDHHKFYFPGGVLAARPSPAIKQEYKIRADNEETVKLEGLPAGTVIKTSVNGIPKAVTIRDGVWEWSTAYPGRYVLWIEMPDPYESRQFRITAYA